MSRKIRAAMSTRRDVLANAGLAGLALLATRGESANANEANKKTDAAQPPAHVTPPVTAVSVAKKGKYATVPLRQDAINVTAIQSRVLSVDVKNIGPSMKAGVAHVLHLIDMAQGSAEEWGGERLWGAKQDLVCLHEFPIQGFQPWTRAELNRVAIELPGPETAAIGERAKKYGCYIAFGCYAHEKGWDNHVINMSVIIGPNGDIVSKQWKARNVLGLFGEGALIGTTIYDVLDRYVEMYGWDATMPVARTDIGNLCMTSVGAEPLLYQCQALKGAEIIILSVTGGSNAPSAIATARASRVYTVGVGNAVSPNNPGFLESAGAGEEGSVIVDPRGTVLGRTANHHEDLASARVAIADFRRTRRFPEYPMALMLPVLQQYEPVFQPNAFLDYLPTSYKDSGDYIKRRMGGK